MSEEEGKAKAKTPVNLENSLLQAAANQSITLPKDILAKAETPENPTTNISALQAATTQCASLPQNRKVVRETFEDSAKKS
jgi:hypothetical protein